MNDHISVGVSSFKMDKTGKFCLLKFYPQDWKSEEELKKTQFYTIVDVSELRAHGGIPKYCDLKPAQDLNNKEIFQNETSSKPATFEGISHSNAGKGLLWYFKEPNPSLDDICGHLDQMLPSAKYELRDLLAKHLKRI